MGILISLLFRTNNSSGINCLSSEIKNYVKTFLPVDLFVSIDERTCNPYASY